MGAQARTDPSHAPRVQPGVPATPEGGRSHPPPAQDGIALDLQTSGSLQGIRQGDVASFEALFHAYCQDLIRFACRFTRDTPVAEDIVQEVFLRVWRDRSRLAPAANVKAYLYAAVRNESLNYLRHAEVEARSAPELALAARPVKTPEDERSAKAAAASVYAAVARLPERRRLIFRMNRFDHLTYAEIAQVLEISIKTVETQMGRALAFLRAELVDSPDE